MANSKLLIVLCALTFVKRFNGEISKEPRKAVKACQELESKYASPAFGFRSGETVDYGEFPYMAGLGYRQMQNNSSDDTELYEIKCGGFLIAAKFVLTAAHCTYSHGLAVVRLNALNFASTSHLRNVIDVPIKAIHVHENFSMRKQHNDIAILELERDVEFTPNLRPACLYVEKDDPPADKKYYVTGWGIRDTRTREKLKLLHKTPVKIVPLAQCKAEFTSLQIRLEIIDSHLCAKTEEVIDACQGDSGGPLSMVVDDTLKTYQVVGIISLGLGCLNTYPAVYTRVSSYLDWIENIVWPEKENNCQCVCPK